MANPEHLCMLKEGTYEWNAWREENPDVRPDLGGAKLQETDLTGFDLSQANLFNADLSNADLSLVNARSADFSSAVLIRTILRSADLRRIHCLRAHLKPAHSRAEGIRGARKGSRS